MTNVIDPCVAVHWPPARRNATPQHDTALRPLSDTDLGLAAGGLDLSNPPFGITASQDPFGGNPVPNWPGFNITIFVANPAAPVSDVVIRLTARSRHEPAVQELSGRQEQALVQLQSLLADGPSAIDVVLSPTLFAADR
jgi:hypothetical protein